ncbi:MAG TPA: SDR family NAD(P)-dependent oxidoreductase [Thermoanaerobaculia bacterium]|nr:SDR family NAD(P)-dependent oxidoreductase [Thermoanaerobaculia bacterium]
MAVTIDLSPRTALVTGGSRGIGRATAELLAEAGAKVAVNYRADDRRAEEFVRQVRSAGGEALALAGDLSRPEEARQLVRDVLAAWGRLDVVVNNAGIWEEDRAGAGDLDTWDRTFAVNVRGAFALTDVAIAPIEKEKGSIVFVSSTAAQRGEARHSAYAASKGALISYTKSLAVELGPRGIRVNCVAPGWVDTEMTAGALGDADARAEIERSIPVGRVGRPEDVAAAILFLVSDLARHVQGEVLNVNGGSVLAG